MNALFRPCAGALVGNQQGLCESQLCLLRLLASLDLLLLRQGAVGLQLVRTREPVHAQRQYLPAHHRQRRKRKPLVSLCQFSNW